MEGVRERREERGEEEERFGWFFKSLFLKEYFTRKQNNADSLHT